LAGFLPAAAEEPPKQKMLPGTTGLIPTRNPTGQHSTGHPCQPVLGPS